MTIYAKELQRRLNSGEPYNTTAQWYIHLKEPWQMYFHEGVREAALQTIPRSS